MENKNSKEKRENQKNTIRLKSNAKAAGLKSTFRIGDNLLMTSFGKGNAAILEKEIFGTEIVNINEKPEFDVEQGEKSTYNINGKIVKDGQVVDPRVTNPNIMKKKIKDKLEMEYFGRTFDDSVHIQLIYNILDIEKILAVHINNIVYSINNLRGYNFKNGEFDDFIGYMSMKNTYHTFCNYKKSALSEDKKRNIEKCSKSFDILVKSKRLGYFGKYFEPNAHDKNSSQLREKLYYIFCLLGQLRQSLIHSIESSKDFLYTFDRANDSVSIKAKQYLDDAYDSKIKSLNASFIKNNKTNIYILTKIFNISVQSLIQEFYDFTVPKTYKNIGFSIKKLREKIVEIPQASFLKLTEIEKTEVATAKSKLYKLLDFMIYMQYKNDPVRIERNVTALRSIVDEAEKELFYEREAKEIWGRIGIDVKNKLMRYLKPNTFNEVKNVKEYKGNIKYPSACNATYLTKIIYMLTMFLDGKEINDLLTTLINKFDNIASFIDVLNGYDMKTDFAENYKIFEKSKELVNELRIVNSFARMEKPAASAKKNMFIDAAKILGYKESDEALNAFMDKILENKVKGKNGFRNFIASNVIESDRFRYLIRYSNAQNIRKLADNRDVVRFVLSGIPDTQIDRYCKSCNCSFGSDMDAKRESLADIITGISFNEFRNVNQNDRLSTPQQKADKAQKQAVISLYLTVLYLLVKNLVYVNSRYSLAFHCLERDLQIFGNKVERSSYTKLTEEFIKESENARKKAQEAARAAGMEERKIKYVKSTDAPLNYHACEYLKNNIACSDDYMIRVFRNNVAHLGAVRNASIFLGDIRKVDSYFAMYHYIMQKAIQNQYKHDRSKYEIMLTGHTEQYFESITQYHTYCMDFVKALNTPFGYNLPRYKNLTIDALFDKNFPKENKEDMLAK